MKIYRIHTNGYDMIATTEIENGIEVVRFYTTEAKNLAVSLSDIEDDTGWEGDCRGMTFEEFIAVPDGQDKNEITEETEF